MFTKKNNFFLKFLDFLEEKLNLDYVINTKSQILQNFFPKSFYLSAKASLQPKKILKNFYLKFKFLLIKKCISYNFHYENYMISIFLTKIKIMFLRVKMHSFKKIFFKFM